MTQPPQANPTTARHISAGITSATPAFFRIADVMRITALSRATLYRRIAEGKFPLPVHLGGRACGWTPTALQAWIDDPEGYIAPNTRVALSRRP